ncbi:phenylacetaldoxime dehydratase family protein [Sphingomonas flavalba]|uniref:phenylacetaldoxime dehydratase family protein n=1 Tax=Sphingomonas flavalba TaxID=2559804 RepID=UPI0039E08B77
MKSAIPLELQAPRSCPRRCPEGFTPPYGAWVARDHAARTQLVMAYFGVQYDGPAMRAPAEAAFDKIVALLGGEHAAGHVDQAGFRDDAGYDTLVAIAYWDDPNGFDRWRQRADVAGWWESDARLADGPGYFREVFLPTNDRFETLFSSLDQPEGVAIVMGGLDPEDVQEHSYWGSMRDRIAAAQGDPLAGADARPAPPAETLGRRVRVGGVPNLAVIRSGQDWGATRDAERDMYLNDIEPVLDAGMRFLTTEGQSIGCWTNRYMRIRGKQKSFGLGYWRSLGDMEAWAESHSTHIAIFDGFLQMAAKLNFQLALRLYHEVSVMTPDQQFLEYINCHKNTGLIPR